MEWINIKDQLPTDGDKYNGDIRCIVYGIPRCGSHEEVPTILEARYNITKKEFDFVEYDCSIDVTYWMPLPEVPNDH